MDLQEVENKEKKKKKLQKNKENLFWNPIMEPVMLTTLVLLKQIPPSNYDRTSLIDGHGSTFYQKRNVSVSLSFKLKDFYKLLCVKQNQSSRTTSRQATPIGDPRGVPKRFSSFWSFSKRSTKSLPICLEGFRNRKKQDTLAVLQKIQIDKATEVFTLRTQSEILKIQLNITMDSTENPPLMDQLFDLIENADFDFSSDEVLNNVDLERLLGAEPNNNEIITSSNSNQLDVQITTNASESLFPVEQEEILIDTSSDEALQLFAAPAQTTSSPQFTITLPTPPQITTMPQYFIQVPESNQLVPVQVDLGAQPVIANPVVLSNIESPLNSSTKSNADQYTEMRRKNNIACEQYRGRRRRQKQETEKELEALQKKNDLLNMRVNNMETIIKELRARVITNIANPETSRRRRRRSDDNDNTGQEYDQSSKRFRSEP